MSTLNSLDEQIAEQVRDMKADGSYAQLEKLAALKMRAGQIDQFDGIFMRAIHVEPGDVIVYKSQHSVRPEVRDLLAEAHAGIFGDGIGCAFLDADMELQIYRVGQLGPDVERVRAVDTAGIPE